MVTDDGEKVAPVVLVNVRDNPSIDVAGVTIGSEATPVTVYRIPVGK